MNDRIGLLYSGGIDSTAVMGLILSEGDIPYLINIDYGAVQNFREQQAMDEIISWYGIRGRMFGNSTIVIPNGVMCASEVAKRIPDKKFDSMDENLTIYSGRNAVLISIAAALCISRGVGYLYIGVGPHDAEGNLFPDCTPEFINYMRGALARGYGLTLRAPLLDNDFDRATIIKGAYVSRLPLHLTYSCYRGAVEHCGACPTCYGRQQSFLDAGYVDPTPYRKVQPALIDSDLEEWDVSNW